jgi:hypothetical protein
VRSEVSITLRKEYGSPICARYDIYPAQSVLGPSDPKVTAQHYLEPKQSAVLGFGHLLRADSNVVEIADEKAASFSLARRSYFELVMTTKDRHPSVIVSCSF